MAVLWTVLSPLFFGYLPPVQACEEGKGQSFTDGFVHVDIGKDAPEVSLAAKPDKIAIYVLGPSRELMQEIPYDAALLPELDDNERVKAEDMNFDGYTDLKIMSSRGNANVYYHCWLWDRKQQKFVFHEALSNLASPMVDADMKRILSFTHVSATDSTEEVYTFQKNKLRLLELIERTYDGEGNVLITRQYSVDKKGVRNLVREQTVIPEETEEESGEMIPAPFPNATLYHSSKGFSLLLPEGAVAQDTVDGVEIRDRKWLVIVSQLGAAVEHLDNPGVQADLEERAPGQNPLVRCKIEWSYGTDKTTLNGYDFYRRPFAGTVDGAAMERGTFYYGNVNGKHFRVVSIQFPGISDGIIPLTKMLYTFVVE
jgi:hypothetical protein